MKTSRSLDSVADLGEFAGEHALTKVVGSLGHWRGVRPRNRAWMPLPPPAQRHPQSHRRRSLSRNELPRQQLCEPPDSDAAMAADVPCPHSRPPAAGAM